MKVSFIIIAILSGWLFSEIKDFILNGGFDNKLATILLKIVFILLGIIICTFLDYEKYFQPKEKHETPSTPPPELETNKSVRSRSNSRGRRSQVKPIDFNVYSD